jgi:CubicO group peptidase (beta-lactamase class C family)
MRVAAIACSCLLVACSRAPSAITLDNSQRERIDALFARFNAKTPGCSLGIMSDGAMIYSQGYGMASVDPPVANNATRLFDVASISKQFVAGSVVLLAQQGRLKLTDDVRKFIPELPNYGSTITVDHLLWHTSGLRDYTELLNLGGFDYPDVTTQAQALEFVTRQRGLKFAPGTRWDYSNSGYLLLAIIAERVSGKAMNELAREQFFNPLGMPQSIYRDRHDQKIPNQALGHDFDDASKRYLVHIAQWEQIGDGGLQTSIDEFQQWDENFYSGTVGGRAFISEMYRTGQLNDGRPLTYARGLQLDTYRGLKRVRHGGDWVGYHGNTLRFPSLHTTVALFCNSEDIDQYQLSMDVTDIALERYFTEPKPKQPGPAPSLPIERFIGTYFNAERNEIYSLTVGENALVLNLLFYPMKLISTGPTTFTIEDLPGSEVTFQIQDGKRAHAISFVLSNDEPDEEPRLGSRFSPVASPADLNQYAGTFFSSELGVAWTFAVENGSLTLAPDAEQIVLPLAGPVAPANVADSFFGGAGLLQFTRDASGAVNGIDVSFSGMKDFRFVRR